MVVDSRGAPKPKGVPNPETWVPPSQQPPPQHPAVKPGEPIPYGTRPPDQPPPPEETIGGGGEETTRGASSTTQQSPLKDQGATKPPTR